MGDSGSRQAEIAYEAIAPVYDEFTANHDYELWLGNLLPVLERQGLQGQRLLDVGCGTGKSSAPMVERGWEVTACDISPSMIAIARQKLGSAATFLVADMCELPRLGEFDLVWAVDDAANYLLSKAELERALIAMAKNLGPGGLLMFDLNTLQSFRTFFAETVVVDRDDKRLIWRGMNKSDAAPGTIGEAVFEVEDGVGSAGIPPRCHRQRHFPEAEVLAALPTAGLECLAVYGHHYDAILRQPLNENQHTKAVYIARLRRGT